MKTKEELNALKEEVEAVNKKLLELTEEELAQVSGGGELPGGPTFDINGNTPTPIGKWCIYCTVGSDTYNDCEIRTDTTSPSCKFHH